MKVGDMFPSKYLKGADLQGSVTVTIERVSGEKIWRPGEGEVTGWVMYCRNASKGVILSRALATAIAKILGEDDAAKWAGKQIQLYPEPLKVAGQDVVAIRARAVPGIPAESPA